MLGMKTGKQIKVITYINFNYMCSYPENKAVASTFKMSRNRSPFPYLCTAGIHQKSMEMLQVTVLAPQLISTHRT